MEDILKQMAFDVIEEEGLPKPREIKFKHTIGGTKRMGVCMKYRLNNDFKLIINTTKIRWFEDPEGQYKDKEGTRFRKATIGEKLSDEDVKETLAHEIAHLKFWQHDAQHKSYTLYILNKINEKLDNVA